MYEPDTTAILPGDEEVKAYGSNFSLGHEEDTEPPPPPPPTSRPAGPPFACPLPVSVEPVMFLSVFAVVLQAPLITQYLWDRISEDLGYNASKSSECGNRSAGPNALHKVNVYSLRTGDVAYLPSFILG